MEERLLGLAPRQLVIILVEKKLRCKKFFVRCSLVAARRRYCNKSMKH
jgi:hypothetical protein